MKVFRIAARSRAASVALASLALTLAPLSDPVSAQARPLDHDAYDRWLSISGESLSGDGAWVLYRLTPRVGDATLVVKQPDGAEHRVERVSRASFSPDSRHAVFTIVPAHDSVRTLRLAETRSADMPPDTLGIMELATGAVTRIPDAEGWSVPEEAGDVVVYEIEEEGAEEDDDERAEEAEAEEEDPATSGREQPDTHTLVLRTLATGAERRMAAVTDHELSEDGRRLVYATSGQNGALDGVRVMDVATGDSTVIASGPGVYRRLALSEDGRQVAFLTDRDEAEAEHPAFSVYHWRDGRDAAARVAGPGTEGLPADWVASAERTPWFSDSGARLFFGSAPRRGPAPEDSLLEEERVELDVWHWQDDLLQPMQLLEADDERERSYTAVVHLDRRGEVVQLETPGQPNVDVGREGDADVALVETGVPYRHLVGIESPGFSDVWLVNVRTGDRERIIETRQVSAHLSPDARYIAWYDYGDRHWHALDLDRRRQVNLTESLPYPVWDEMDDHPMPPSPYGIAGWTSADDELLVYDQFDIWALDPDGRSPARRITDGYGRANGLELRYERLDPEQDAIEPGAPMLLEAFDVRTKQTGFFRDRAQGGEQPRRLLLEPKQFGNLEKADDAPVLLYTREDVSEFPDLWVADLDFGERVKISDANPWQDEYNWATVELVEWLSTDGIPLQGLLYKPADFDPSKRYPMLVNFYERSSDNLYEHAPPLPHRSVIRPTFYASRGYIVFVPDVVYRVGYPGESAMHSVMPGVLKLAAEPWIDESNVGVQGHSWGGYQIAYMLTQTDFFKAAEAGAPVANMTSAYGGIRYGSGMSRMFQYEHTQSRIGGSLWETPIRYFENSPLFFLDKVETPLLIMHNDEDGAVPWTQGIELFVGLRRLDKPAWLINYNDEPHWPTTAANIRDWNIRMQQFFDHFLQGAPAPVWLAEGIPATEKGRTLGLEAAEPTMAGEGERTATEGGSR